MEHDPHSSPIKTPKQLIIVVVLAFAIPITLAGLLSQLATSGSKATDESKAAVIARIKPVGTFVMAQASSAQGNLTGEQVFGQVCKTCHEAGLVGAPKAGDKAAWGPRIAEGEATLSKHAVDGFQGKSGVMPPKGGSASLSDDEVHRAVVYMANLAGAGWKEPASTAPASIATANAAPVAAATAVAATAVATTTVAAGAASATPAAATAPGPAAAPATATAPAVAVASAAGSDAGKKVYDETCHVCHATGLLGSPKFGDKAAWAPRIATGTDTLYNAALHGLRSMPPRGGNANLTDAEVKAAVNYMTAAAK